MSSDFKACMTACTGLINARLDEILTATPSIGEHERPARLVSAMRHGVLNGGKRLRPFLMIETAKLFGVGADVVLDAACGLECLHSYSLIHDDLPAMDDVDLRRGQPTVHKAFDEATAILAGDALLTLAFDLVTTPNPAISNTGQLELANLLARASGQGGMIGGQVLDIQAESGSPTEEEIRRLQAMKTGALIRYACEAGAIIGNATTTERKTITRFGEIVGLSFQLADDLLDVTSNSQVMGKAVGKDAQAGKGTLVGIYGVDKVRQILQELKEEAEKCLAGFENIDTLRDTANFIVAREH